MKGESSQKTLKINNCDQDLLKAIQTDINDGVYKCGFARNQDLMKKRVKAFLML